MISGGGGLLLLAAGIGLALFFGRRVTGVYSDLSTAAAAVGRGETPKTARR